MMGTKASLKMASRRFFEFTGLILIIFFGVAFGSALGKAAVVSVGSDLQEAFFPALAPAVVAVDDTEKGATVLRTMPAFQVVAQEWVGQDLLLASGTLCKAEDYDFVDAKIAYGTPTGVFQPALVIFRNRSSTRVPGCQTWQNWLLVGARAAKAKQWFLVVQHKPKHGMWTVRQTIGPFAFPDRSTTTAGTLPSGK